jgi:uncharacterized protein YndB with AHSA1/START domain
MRIRERTEIDRPAAHVWHFIITPELFLRWNDKVVESEARGAFQLGQRFHTRYQMTGKQLQCWSAVTALEEGRLLELQHGNCSGKGVHGDIKVIERITLEEKHSRTIVIKDVHMMNHGIPWFIVPIIWFITRFGKPVGKNRLKELCEGRVP